MNDLFRYEETLQMVAFLPDCGDCPSFSIHFLLLRIFPLRSLPGRNFEAYLSGLRERALNGDPAAARELAVHYDVEGNAAETSKWMSEYVSLAEKRANNGDVDSMLDLGKLFYTGSRLYPKNLERARYWFTPGC